MKISSLIRVTAAQTVKMVVNHCVLWLLEEAFWSQKITLHILSLLVLNLKSLLQTWLVEFENIGHFMGMGGLCFGCSGGR